MNPMGIATMPLLVLLLGAAPAAYADDKICRGRLGARTVDNLVVPDGSTCTLKGTRVKGMRPAVR